MASRWRQAAKVVTVGDVVVCLDYHKFYALEGVPGWRAQAFNDVDEGRAYAWLVVTFDEGYHEVSWQSSDYGTVAEAWVELPAFLGEIRAGLRPEEEAW